MVFIGIANQGSEFSKNLTPASWKKLLTLEINIRGWAILLEVRSRVTK